MQGCPARCVEAGAGNVRGLMDVDTVRGGHGGGIAQLQIW
jgi:hypothetical protein